MKYAILFNPEEEQIRWIGHTNLSKGSILPYFVNLKDRDSHIGSDKNSHKCPGAAEQLSELQASLFLEEYHLSDIGRILGANNFDILLVDKLTVIGAKSCLVLQLGTI